MGQYYAFACTICGQNLRAMREDAQNRVQPGGGLTLYRYRCPKCHCYFMIKSTAMLPIAAVEAVDQADGDQDPDDTDGGIRRIEKTIDHFRSYQYGEPLDGEPVAMRHSFDIEDSDAEVILLGLDILKDLREIDTSIDASVNHNIRMKLYDHLAEKAREELQDKRIWR